MSEKTSKRNLLKSILHTDKELILNYLNDKEKTTCHNEELIEILGKTNYKYLEDRLKYLEETEDILIKTKEGKANIWKLKDKTLLSKEMSQKDIINLNYALCLNKDNFDTSTLQIIDKIFKSNSTFMKGHISIYEELNDPKINDFYKTLITSIKERKYLILEFKEDFIAKYLDVKPIRIIFIDNNWYIAFESQDKKFVLRRLVFLENIIICNDYDYSNKNTFQKVELEKYLDFIENPKKFQNAMTLYGVENKTATIKATPLIAKYFKADMKKFFSSQKVKEELSDGSILFEVQYTQYLEILPFIQKWLPDLIILEPKELRDAYKVKLDKMIENMKDLK